MSLPNPPGMRVVTLPRQPEDKPQETSIAVNPRNPMNLVASYHQAVGEGSDHHPDVSVEARVAWSADGGETWTVAEGTTHEDFRISLDAAVVFDLRGHAYLVYLTIDKPDWTSRQGEYVARSIDGGRTWEAPITRIEHQDGHEPLLEHMPHIAADNHEESPYAGNVYVIWDRLDPTLHEPGRTAINFFVRSTDGGESWSEPILVSEATGQCMSLGVGRDGTIYLMTTTYPDLEVQLVISSDGGQTFQEPLPVVRGGALPSPDAVKSLPDFPRSYGWPVIAVDSREVPATLHVVWGDHRHGDRDVFATTSDDGGRTWTEPVRVNDDPIGNGKDQLMQFAAVDPTDGALYVLFYDRRDDPDNVLTSVTLARSTDGGRTFANYAWSDGMCDPTQASLGDYIGLAALGGRVYGVWPETLPPVSDGGPDPAPVMFLGMEFEPRDVPSGPTALRVGIADFRSGSDGRRR